MDTNNSIKVENCNSVIIDNVKANNHNGTTGN